MTPKSSMRPGTDVAVSPGDLGPLETEAAKALAKEVGVHEFWTEFNAFRVFLHHPRLAKALSQLLGTLLVNPVLSPRVRELMIMRIAWVTGSVYEWGQHWPVAKAVGLSDDEIVAVQTWRESDRFDEPERTVLAVTDELLENGSVSDETWAACQRVIGDGIECLEVLGVVACWSSISAMLRCLRVPLDEGLESWPPDGVAPLDATTSAHVQRS